MARRKYGRNYWLCQMIILITHPPDRRAQPKRYDPDTLPVDKPKGESEGAYGNSQKNGQHQNRQG